MPKLQFISRTCVTDKDVLIIIILNFMAQNKLLYGYKSLNVHAKRHRGLNGVNQDLSKPGIGDSIMMALFWKTKGPFSLVCTTFFFLMPVTAS